MAEKVPWDIIYKCFKNQGTPEEVKEVQNWAKEDKENLRLLEEIYNVYSISNKIPRSLNPNMQKAWERIDKNTQAKSPGLFLNRFKYIAASVAIILGLATFWLINTSRIDRNSKQFTEIITPMGQKTMVILPDGSTVWLNSGSNLKYSRDFNNKQRYVELNGEAYFEVQKDKTKQFRVEAGRLDVDVYGTSFNIKNYSDDKLQEIVVAEGIVGIADRNKEIKRLVKGERVQLNKESGKITFSEANINLSTAWKENELIFKNTPFVEVVKYLERWYGVNITIDPTMEGKHNYTFKLKTESFREVLEMIKIMTPLEYEIKGKDVTIKYSN